MGNPQAQLEKKLKVAEKVATKHGLPSVSKKSFIKLCKIGCDPLYLSDRLFILSSTTQVQITTKLGKGAVRRTTKHLTSIRPLDSAETSLGGFKPTDIKTLRNQLLEVAHIIESLSYSIIVNEILKNYSPDIRNLPELLLRYANEILPSVSEITKKTGAKFKPDYNRILREIVEHVENATGGQNYKLISEVLEGIGSEMDEGALKQNIYRQRSAKGGNVK